MSYSFFSKPMGSKFNILETSAASYQSKKASLSQEVVRRLLNTDEERPQEEKIEIIDEYCRKLEGSGYSKDQQKEIIEAGLIGYKRRIERQGGIRHRKCKTTEKNREKEKLTG